MTSTPCAPTAHAKIPVTIITGFLGSGKTTLLNHVLRNKGERSVAVIENEFGEVNIDSSLVSETVLEKEDLVSLQNGCLCCSLRKDIVKALAELERRSKARGRPVNNVIIETTGLADPAPVAFTFFANPWIAARYKLDSIICLVDAKHLVRHLEDERSNSHAVNEVVQQIAFADLLLLNKTDLLGPEELKEVESRIRTINHASTVVHCQLNNPDQCPPLSLLLDTRSFSLTKACQVDPTFLDSDSEPGCQSDSDTEEGEDGDHCSASDQHSTHSTRHSSCGGDAVASTSDADQPGCSREHMELHMERQPKRKHKKMHDLSGIGSVGIVAEGPLDEYRFNAFMRDLLAEKSKDILRCKGILQIQGYGDTKFVFQGVHETLRYGPAEVPWRKDEPRRNQLVFIGYNLNRKAMMESFRSCVWVPLPEGWQEVMDPATKRPYYFNPTTRQKTWARPQATVLPTVKVHQVSTSQPTSLLPRQPVTRHEE